MPVYVDQAENALGRMKMCHMIADTAEELHEMALAIGMRREWFQPTSFPHYDVAKGRRRQAILRGAVVVTKRQLVLKMKEVRAREQARLNGSPENNGDWRQTWA